MPKKKYEIECCICNKKQEGREKFKRLNKGWMCTNCRKEEREKKRDFLLHEIAGIRRRSDLEKEWAENRKKKEIERNLPKIIGADRKKKGVNKAMGTYLRKDEKELLFRKYVKEGLPPEKANRCIEDAIEFLKLTVEKLKEQGKEEGEINRIFKEEFAKICEERLEINKNER